MRRGFNNMCLTNGVFQSTHPVWDATRRVGSGQCDHSISIHASRMGCDRHPDGGGAFRSYFNPRIPYGMRLRTGTRTSAGTHFNPRIPYGMRPALPMPDTAFEAFQSTHPVWDATCPQKACTSSAWPFQSTHPVWDATLREQPHQPYWYFNPRIPYGMRRGETSRNSIGIWISIHASRMGCDAVVARRFTRWRISIHASRMGCDTQLLSNTLWTVDFNPRIPYGMRLREWTLHSIIWKLLPALRADYIADIPEHLSVCIFGL